MNEMNAMLEMMKNFGDFGNLMKDLQTPEL